MANCSTPSSIPATGRILTRSSRRSRKSSSAFTSFFGLLQITKASLCWALRFSNVQRSTLNAQRSTHSVKCWMLDVERSTFSAFRRVKGAWWPSRSSKPPSSRLAGRGRFDSYPLRLVSTICSRFAVRNAHIAHRATVTPLAKGGEFDVA